MNKCYLFFIAVVTPMLMAATLPAVAATSPAMVTCKAQWTEMTEADSIPQGLTWSKFWSSCSKDYAATHRTDAGRTRAAATTKTPTATKTIAVNEDEPTGSSAADKDACDGKWVDYKTRTHAHGWKVYFTFMSKCMP
jgi:hypothetical protein